MKHLSIVLLVAACGGGSQSTAPAQPAAPAQEAPAAAAADMVQPPPPAPPPAVGHPKDDLIPRTVLFGNPERTNVKISPDGKQLSWTAPKDGVMNIWIAPIDKLDQAKPVTAETKRPVRGYTWAFDGKHVLYTQDAGGDENFHVFRVDLADGNKVTDLTPGEKVRASIAGMDDTTPGKIVVSMNDRDPKFFDLYTFDLATGKRTLLVLDDGGFSGFTLDARMRPRLAIKNKDDGSNEIYVTDDKPVKDGKRTWTLFDTIPFEDATATSPVGIAPDGKSFYMTDSRVSDTGALVSVDFATKKQTTIATDPKSEVSDQWMQTHTGKLQAVQFNYQKPTWTVIDKSIAGDIAAIQKLTDGTFDVTSETLGEKKLLVATHTPQKPNDFYVYDRASKKATFLFTARPELEKYKLAAMTPVEIPTRDGLTMVGYLTLPASVDPTKKPAKPLPMVLWVHGGPWARDEWGPNPFHQLFADRGYAVLSVNYRGSTGFGKKFVNASNLQWGKKMHDDLLDSVKWAEQQGIAQANDTCIAGGSYGGYATLAGLTMTPDAFVCGVDLVGPSNLITLLSTIPPYWAPIVSLFHKRMGDPNTPEGKALLTSVSPLTYAQKIKKPLLIGQGQNDPRVNVAESEQIVAAMQKHGLPVTYALFPDEGHGFARPENNIAFFGAAEAFLSAHLGGYYLPLSKDEISASSMQIKSGAEGIPGLPK
ncbi:MAG: S9 family peptidase [Kofleriaceae bacterium]